MALSDDDILAFRERGFLVVEGVFRPAEMAALKAAAGAIVDAFDPARHSSVFSTDDRDRGRDQYFFDSAEAMHCFLEAGAVDGQGRLNRDKALAINKIGHALHDHDPSFRAFCRHPWFGAALRDIGFGTPKPMSRSGIGRAHV